MSKSDPICRTYHRHGPWPYGPHANGCERLRTVAQRLANTPQPPDPQSETGTLATHSGKNDFSERNIILESDFPVLPFLGEVVPAIFCGCRCVAARSASGGSGRRGSEPGTALLAARGLPGDVRGLQRGNWAQSEMPMLESLNEIPRFGQEGWFILVLA